MILLASTEICCFMHNLGRLFGSCVLESSIYNSSVFSKVPKTTGKKFGRPTLAQCLLS